MTAIVVAQGRLEALESEYERMLRGSFFETCRFFWTVREEQLFLPEYGTFTNYCEQRWDFTPTRGHQLASAFEVCRNLAEAAASDDVPLFFQHWLAGLSESHARVLKQLPPDQQADAWEAARAIEERPTAKVVQQVVEQFQTTAADIEAMPADQQSATLRDIEDRAGKAYTARRLMDWYRLTLKRLKRPLEEARREELRPFTAVGTYTVTGGLVGLLDEVSRQCEEQLGK